MKTVRNDADIARLVSQGILTRPSAELIRRRNWESLRPQGTGADLVVLLEAEDNIASLATVGLSQGLLASLPESVEMLKAGTESIWEICLLTTNENMTVLYLAPELADPEVAAWLVDQSGLAPPLPEEDAPGQQADGSRDLNPRGTPGTIT